MNKRRTVICRLVGWMIVSGLAIPAVAGDSWDSAARKIAADVRASVRVDEAVVTHVDPDGRRVYFSGFAAAETGAAALFYRKSDTGVIPQGVGRIEGSQGILSWAVVERELGERIQPDNVVRLEPALSGISVTPFYFDTTVVSHRVPAAARILRRLVAHHLREKGIEPRLVNAAADEWDSGLVPGPALVARAPRASLLMGCVIRRSRPDELVVRAVVYDVPSIYMRVDREYPIDIPRGLDLVEEIDSLPGNPAASAVDGLRRPPSGVLRLAVPTMPAGLDGMSYRIDTSSPSEIVLVRRTPGDTDHRPDTVIVTIDTDAKSRLARFELGESDIHVMSDAEFLKFTTSTAYINRVVTGRASSLMALAFRLSRPVVEEWAFRRAVWHALDRRATLDVLLNNRGTIARGFLPPAKTTAGRVASRDGARTPAKARGLWSGNPKKPVRVGVLVPAEESVFSLVAERIQADLKGLGVNIVVERLPWHAYAERVASGAFDMALVTWPQSRALNPWLARRFHSSESENVTAYANAAFDALCTDTESIDEINNILLMDIPAIPLFWLTTYAVLGERVESAIFEQEPVFSLDGIRLAK